MEEMSDDALLWWVSKGWMIEPFNSAMPASKDTLSVDEIWQEIATFASTLKTITIRY